MDIIEGIVQVPEFWEHGFEYFLVHTATGEKVEYTIKVKNVGIVSNGFEIKDAIPAEIEVKELEYQTDDEESVKIPTSKQEVSI